MLDRDNGTPRRGTSTQDASPRNVPARDIAIQFLARREYSRVELESRMRSKGVENEEIRTTLDDLARADLQSDARFAEVFVRSRVARGQGPVKIRVDLGQRGISEPLMVLAFETESPDWQALACQALAKRFDDPGATPRERAKRERFLAGRGFEFDHVRHAMAYAW